MCTNIKEVPSHGEFLMALARRGDQQLHPSVSDWWHLDQITPLMSSIQECGQPRGLNQSSNQHAEDQGEGCEVKP